MVHTFTVRMTNTESCNNMFEDIQRRSDEPPAFIFSLQAVTIHHNLTGPARITGNPYAAYVACDASEAFGTIPSMAARFVKSMFQTLRFLFGKCDSYQA